MTRNTDLRPARILALLTAALLPACPPTFVSPPNPDPSTLDVRVSVTDASPPGSQGDDGKVLADMQFFQGGKTVRFQNGETATCNGIALPFNELLGYVARVPRPTGSTISCTYTRVGGTATLAITVPPRPVITSPASGATVPRSTTTTVSYVADGGTGVDAGGSDATTGLSRGQPQPDNGTYTGFDTTGFAAGSGTISLTRIAETTTPQAGFNSTHTEYRISNSIPVAWQ